MAQTGHVKISFIDGVVPINVQNLHVKRKFSKVLKSCLLELAMPHNGPAIKGGCVTRRKHRAVPSTRDGTLA
jgi:hypothetical protein